jgi:CubicO group peptidase (beta-lactamase class C family)
MHRMRSSRSRAGAAAAALLLAAPLLAAPLLAACAAGAQPVLDARPAAVAAAVAPLPPRGLADTSATARRAAIEGALVVRSADGSTARAPLAERMAHYSVPAVSVAVIDGGRLHWAHAWGVVRAGGAQPADTATLFQAASISKPVAAMAALRLVEQGRLELDGDVNGRLRAWRVEENEHTRAEKVTLRRLLSHGAGLTVHGFAGYPDGSATPSLVQLLNGERPANSARVRLDIAPGSAWRYSGGGTSVAQLLMLEAAGTDDFPALMRSLVLEPAGMQHSTYQQPLPPARRGAAAVAHDRTGSPLAAGWHVYPEMAAAGLWTTPSDLARLVLDVQRALRGEGGTLLSADVSREMLRTQIGSWGLGWTLGGSGPAATFSHGGSNAGYKAQLTAFVEGGRGAVIMTNGDQGTALIREVMAAVAEVYGWPR